MISTTPDATLALAELRELFELAQRGAIFASCNTRQTRGSMCANSQILPVKEVSHARA